MNLRTASTNHPVWNTANSPLSAQKMEHEVRIGPGLTRAGGQDDGSFTNSLKLLHIFYVYSIAPRIPPGRIAMGCLGS